MNETESSDQSFIVKIWLEEVDVRTGRPVWRGRVTHVPSGAHANFTTLTALCAFIEPYLTALGVSQQKRSLGDRLFGWWKRGR